MKKNSILLALFGVLVATAGAASNHHESTVNLPTYVVEAKRGSDIEELVNESLKALRDSAYVPVTVPLDLPALRATVKASPLSIAPRMAKL
jgi:hypothetical protein